MKIKLTLLTLAVLAVGVLLPKSKAADCYSATQQCEANRVAYIAGCMAVGSGYTWCSIRAQGEFLGCLRDTGCYDAITEEELANEAEKMLSGR